MNLKYKDKLIQEFTKETPEEILEWTRNKFTNKDNPIFEHRYLWKLSKDKTKVIHETMVSYTELNINE